MPRPRRGDASGRQPPATMPDDTTLMREANGLFLRGDTDAAFALLDRMAAAAPERPAIAAMLAALHERANRPAAAQRHLDRALTLAPDHAMARLVETRLARRAGGAGAALALLDAIDPAPLTAAERVDWLFQRGHALDRLERHDAAFDCIVQARRLDATVRGVATGPLDAGLVPVTIERWFAARTHAGALPAAAATGRGPGPIFVVGFMRSGTTLVEQILASHPAIAALGEANITVATRERFELALGGPFPQALDTVAPQRLARLLTQARADYLARARRRPGFDGKARQFVDKTPFNGMEIGFLRLLFPDAPVVNVVRHPLDTLLSCYFQNFAETLDWAYSLPAAARLYARLHRHLTTMAALLPGPLTTLRYESLVDAFEANVRTLLDFVGAPWDPACLAFHETGRIVRTASYEQVAQPLYRHALERYRPYLHRFDTATIETLQPLIAELGYTLPAMHERPDPAGTGKRP